MPIFLWLIYPIAIWSACAEMINANGKSKSQKCLIDGIPPNARSPALRLVSKGLQPGPANAGAVLLQKNPYRSGLLAVKASPVMM